MPPWAADLAPDLAAVMRALRAVSGAALARTDMKVFQPLIGALTPEALLALGETLGAWSRCLTKPLFVKWAESTAHIGSGKWKEICWPLLIRACQKAFFCFSVHEDVFHGVQNCQPLLLNSAMMP